MVNSPGSNTPTLRRTVPTIFVGLVVTTAATLMLWRVLDAGPLLIGTGLGLVGGLLIGLLIGSSGIAWAVRWFAVVVIAAATVTLAGWQLRTLVRVPRIVATFLTIGLPAAGVEGLAVIPTIIALPATALVVWGAKWRRPPALVGGTISAMIAASLLAVPRGVPIAPLLVTAVGFALLLFIDARASSATFDPLVPGDPGGTDRPALLLGVLAVTGATLAGLAAALIPTDHAIDLRDYVERDVVVARDDSPLAIAARLQTSPPVKDVAATVTVSGPSPGRLRLAVLDDYRSEGWSQQAAFAVTGRTLAADPLFGSPVRPVAMTTVWVRPGLAATGLRAVPTAGSPRSVSRPDDVRYSASAGILLPRRTASIEYRTAAPIGQAADDPNTAAPTVQSDESSMALAGSIPASLVGCPSERLQAIATDLSFGTSEPLQRLARIESWLKLKRIYDPTALGGQTLGSVEQFVDTDLARGNMEAFVTAAALLARCASVPARVVVGFPAPPADATTDFRPQELTSWIEVPMADGWHAFDPVPTPSEQQRQAEIAQQPPPPPAPPPTTQTAPTTPPIVVPPLTPSSSTDDSWWTWVAAVGSAMVLLIGWAVIGPWLVRRRRRHLADPASAVIAAWDTAVDCLVDGRATIYEHHTASEVASSAIGHVPRREARLLAALASLADHARFDRGTISSDDAATAWAVADAFCNGARHPATALATALRHPHRLWSRLRSTFDTERQAQAWRGTIPPDLVLTDDVAVSAIPGFHLDAEIGHGSTSVVYRGQRLDDGQPVAVKIFHHAVDGQSYDRQRFEWEADLARSVSGLANLPEVFASGVGSDGRPFLVSTWYPRGTLADRVRRGGPLSTGEVVTLGQALSLALETLHRSSTLHGDIKPENIFISADGEPILGDLGSSWLRADGGPAASLTPAYAAPEVWLGQHSSTQSDVYSLGLTLMFAASGRAPVPGAPPSTEEIVEAFGTDLFLPLLELDRRRRPRTAGDVARLLGVDADDPTMIARSAGIPPAPTLLASAPNPRS